MTALLTVKPVSGETMEKDASLYFKPFWMYSYVFLQPLGTSYSSIS